MNDSLTTPDFFASKIRMAYRDGDPLLVMKDVCAAISISKYRDALNNLDEDERVSVRVDTLGGQQEMVAVTESGLYHLIFMSRNPVAKKFRRWITEQVIPAIRKTGFYGNPDAAFGEQLGKEMMRVADYMRLRGVEGSPQGFGHSVMAVCRHSGLGFERRKSRGHRFPIVALEQAASGRFARRGPLIPSAPPPELFFIRQ